jgi:hypothetical protein
MKNPFKTINKLLIPIITASIGTFVASWLLYQYESPQIKYYYDDGYYQKINDYSIGEIYLVNEGRKTDENIAIVIEENISPSNISVSYVSSPFHFKNENNRTFIYIDELKPGEEAEVVFKLKTPNIAFSLYNVSSRSGNIHAEERIKPWWHLSKLQAAIVILFTTAGFGGGFVVCLWKNDLLTRKS